jgi:TM2 domain-containing membrane protein YozV
MRNRTVAALLAFFVGGIGIHKFYLGENVAGVLYLLFFWTFIPGIIAFFEFISLIIMSDQVFDAKYNPNYLASNQNRGLQESSREKVATLAQLKKLYDAGIITAEEYEEKRRKYLDSI